MTKRLLAIGQRSAQADEKVKSIFTWMILLLSGVGAFSLYSWMQYWLSGDPIYLMSEAQIAWLSIATLASFIIALLTAVSLRVVRLSYQESTYLKEVEKGYHEPIISDIEPISSSAIQEEVGEVNIRREVNGETIYTPLTMTAAQAVQYYDRIPMNANEIRHLLDQHKGWNPVVTYLENRKIRANAEAFYSLPEKIEKGQAVSWPVQ